MTTLSDAEVRVLGALVEKAITTPEYYPLTMNALINACNQKSNRDPVVSYDQQIVTEALTGLRDKALVRTIISSDNRVPKYREYFADAYELTPEEVAVLGELMLRGPQTIGELRGRIERFGIEQSHAETEQTLENLEIHASGPLVMRLPRQAGRKESRYAHLLAGEPIIEEEAPTAYRESALPGARKGDDRLTALEAEVQQLREELQGLQQQFAEFKQQFE